MSSDQKRYTEAVAKPKEMVKAFQEKLSRCEDILFAGRKNTDVGKVKDALVEGAKLLGTALETKADLVALAAAAKRSKKTDGATASSSRKMARQSSSSSE